MAALTVGLFTRDQSGLANNESCAGLCLDKPVQDPGPFLAGLQVHSGAAIIAPESVTAMPMRCVP